MKYQYYDLSGKHYGPIDNLQQFEKMGSYACMISKKYVPCEIYSTSRTFCIYITLFA